jgi:hypothetical protein
VAIVDSDPADTAVVRDYLGRLHAAGWGLAPERRDELVVEVREHIVEALRAEQAAGHRGEAVVRNVLERLGPPEDIVRAESESQLYGVGGAPPSGYAPFGPPGQAASPPPPYASRSLWGPVEIAAVVLLALGGFVLPILGPVIGLVLVWVSSQWTRTQKVIGSALGLLPVLSIFSVFFSVARF